MPIGGIGSYNNPYTRSDSTPKTDTTDKDNTDSADKTEGTKDKAPVYTAPPATNKNTLTMDSFMQLLAAELKNQDMSNPMSNAEMMGQLTSMATVQAMNTFTELSTTQYAMGMIGQKVQVVGIGADKELEKKTGTVTGIDLASMMLYIDNSKEGYSIGSVMQVGTVPEKETEDDDKDDPKPDGPGGPDDNTPGGTPGTDDKNAKSAPMAAENGYIPSDKAEAIAGTGGMPEDKQQALAGSNEIPDDKKDAYRQENTSGPGVKL